VPAIACEASAPGKLILMGEHAAVYGRPALVAAIGLRTRARIEPTQTGGLVLDLPDLALREECSWQGVIDYGAERRDGWRRWHDWRNDPARRDVAGEDLDPRLPGFGSGDESGLVRVAVAEALRVLGVDREPGDLPGSTLTVASEVPRGAGFGSSASVAVAVGAALLGSFSAATPTPVRAGDERIASVALEVEKRQHGSPSGVDHTAVIQGGFLAVVREAGGLRAAELRRPEWLRDAIRVFDTGMPAETTGEVVEAVRAIREREPAAFDETLDRMEAATRAFTSSLEHAAADWPRLIESIQTFESCLEELGVVPAAVARRVRRIEAAGGAAKISGAGSLSGATAGSLLVVRPPGFRAETLDSILAGYRPLDARLGSAGLELIGGADV
jgi:mevalonate kinase